MKKFKKQKSLKINYFAFSVDFESMEDYFVNLIYRHSIKHVRFPFELVA